MEITGRLCNTVVLILLMTIRNSYEKPRKVKKGSSSFGSSAVKNTLQSAADLEEQFERMMTEIDKVVDRHRPLLAGMVNNFGKFNRNDKTKTKVNSPMQNEAVSSLPPFLKKLFLNLNSAPTPKYIPHRVLESKSRVTPFQRHNSQGFDKHTPRKSQNFHHMSNINPYYAQVLHGGDHIHASNKQRPLHKMDMQTFPGHKMYHEQLPFQGQNAQAFRKQTPVLTDEFPRRVHKQNPEMNRHRFDQSGIHNGKGISNPHISVTSKKGWPNGRSRNNTNKRRTGVKNSKFEYLQKVTKNGNQNKQIKLRPIRLIGLGTENLNKPFVFSSSKRKTLNSWRTKIIKF